MTTKTRVPAVAGLFTLDGADGPRLIGGKGRHQGSFFFPKDLAGADPACVGDDGRDEVELSATGTIWSFTATNYQPPPPYPQTEDYQPAVLAAVELDDQKLVVLGQMVAGTEIGDVAVGQRVRLAVEPHYEDDDHVYMMWKWAPETDSTGSDA